MFKIRHNVRERLNIIKESFFSAISLFISQKQKIIKWNKISEIEKEKDFVPRILELQYSC